MKKNFNKKKLIFFENEIARLFNEGKIKAPIHLSYGNEIKLIKIFKKINFNDWVFCSWRSHYHALLKYIPENLIRKKILFGKSISLCFSKYNFYSSAIVGGILPIALGVALSIKKNKKKNKVYCFIGDMTSETGIAYECIKYAVSFKLPIHFIIEDDNRSVCTNTRKVWGNKELFFQKFKIKNYITHYKYNSKYPHSGAGKRIQF
jgi:pyruvate dehydrogenase E1 component alpha subunit